MNKLNVNKIPPIPHMPSWSAVGNFTFHLYLELLHLHVNVKINTHINNTYRGTYNPITDITINHKRAQ